MCESLGNDKSIVGYYGDNTGSDSSYPVYNWTNVLNSTTGLAISRIFNFKSTKRDDAKKLRDSAVVRCQHPTNYSKCMGTCLFDIVSDPCESQDLSKSLPEVCINNNTCGILLFCFLVFLVNSFREKNFEL